MVGLLVAATVILRHWKTPKSLQVKEWVNMMVKTATYECMLQKLNRKNTTETSLGTIWSYISLTSRQQDNCILT